MGCMMKLQRAINYGSYNWLSVRQLINGDLQISMSEENRQSLQNESDENEYEWPDLWEVLEPMLCNGFDWVDPVWIAALTESPIIGIIDGDPYGDLDNVNWDTSKVWWYPNYQIRNPIEDLIDYGELIFSAQ